jgi:diacylglycerol kinase (ATP)
VTPVPPTQEDDERPVQRLLREPRPGALPKQGSLRWSFTWAFEGVVFVLRTQRNMQVHVAAGVLVLVLALALGVNRFELLALVLAVCLVLVAEMFNTALEAAIDAVITSYHPLVKVAKDVAAGAVLIAALAAVTVAYLVLYGRLSEPGRDLLKGVRQAPTHVVIIVLVVTVIAVVALKAYAGSGSPLRGGFPSGHAAVAFAAWMAVTLIVLPLTHGALVSTLAFLLALLVAQSRVEAGIHSSAEVVAGALLGAGITVLLFQIWG